MALQSSNPDNAHSKASIVASATQATSSESLPNLNGDVRSYVAESARDSVETIKTQLESFAITLELEMVNPLRGGLSETLCTLNQVSSGASLLSDANARHLGEITLRGIKTLPRDRVLRVDTGDDILAIVGQDSLIEREVFHELGNLKFIHSKILGFPAPKLLGTMKFQDFTYLFYSRPGQSLDTIWPSLTTEMKLSVRDELETIFQTLRTLRPSDQDRRFGNCKYNICKDGPHFNHKSSSSIVSEKDFNDLLFSHSGCTLTTEMQNLRHLMARNYEIKLTHGNLHPRNIMVTVEKAEDGSIKDLHVVSITGWEYAGWYPAYWEFVQTMHAADREGPLADWCVYMPYDAIGDYTKEYWKDMARIKGLRSQGHWLSGSKERNGHLGG